MNAATLQFRPREEPAAPAAPAAEPRPTSILVVDIGGSKVKLLATGQIEPRKLGSGKKLTPGRLVEAVQKATHDWDYQAVSVGYPGLVGPLGPRSEPGNLGPGWVGFNFAAAFGKPVRILNDAAMQALGSYEGGRMLFLGLGTGLGSTLIADNVIVPLELGQLPHKSGQTLGEILGRAGLDRLGKETWTEEVRAAVALLAVAFVADYTVVGGGNAKKLKGPLPGVRLGHNLTAFRGGMRLWHIEDVPTQKAESEHPAPPRAPDDWRII